MDFDDPGGKTEGGPEAAPLSDKVPSRSRRQALRQAMRGAAAATAAMLGASAVEAQTSSPLILKGVVLPGKTDAFYRDLKVNTELQAQFIEDPTRVLVKYFVPNDAVRGLPEQRISNANRILYSILANDGFRKWAQAYQAKIEKTGKFDRGEVDRDFASAAVRFGNAALVQALMEDSGSDPSAANSAVVNINWVAVAAVAVAVGFIVIVIVLGILRSPGYTPADFRHLTERMIAKGKALDRSGALRKSYVT